MKKLKKKNHKCDNDTFLFKETDENGINDNLGGYIAL